MGDLVDPLGAIKDFHDCIVEKKYHLALLSRYLDVEDHRNIPQSYKFYHFWFRFLCRTLIRVKIKDITYAFRAFDLDWIRKMDLQSSGFEISPEITLKTWIFGGRIIEVKGRQGRRMQGESKFLFSREGIGYFKVLLKSIIARWTGRWI
jgi:hypothetical protein